MVGIFKHNFLPLMIVSLGKRPRCLWATIPETSVVKFSYLLGSEYYSCFHFSYPHQEKIHNNIGGVMLPVVEFGGFLYPCEKKKSLLLLNLRDHSQMPFKRCWKTFSQHTCTFKAGTLGSARAVSRLEDRVIVKSEHLGSFVKTCPCCSEPIKCCA